MDLSGITSEQLAFSRLLSYVAYQWRDYQIGRHHRLIADKLQAVERGEIKRLMIWMPPRHGKSMLASQYFPAWYLGRNPDHYVMMTSYGQELSNDFGRKVRNQMQDPEYQGIFPGTGLGKDSKAVNRFSVISPFEDDLNGSYFGVGVGGPATGRGAHLLVIDDPLKGREEAESEVQRKKIKDWYTDVAYTRLMPGGAIIIIQTRWHEDDLSGWLLSEGAEEWDVLSLPAINERGEALWPEQFPLEVLKVKKKALTERGWSSLYQQDPTPPSGNHFKREWLHLVDQLPPRDTLHIYGASDYAVTADGGDYTVHIVVGLDAEQRLWVLDLWRRQSSSDEWVEAWCDLVLKWRPMGWAEELGQIKAGVGPFLKKRQIERRAWVPRKGFPTKRDKAVRAQSIRGRIATQGLFIPRHADWTTDFVAELMSFPVGVHDDQADALGLIGQILDRMEDVIVRKEPKKQTPPPGSVYLPGAPEPPKPGQRKAL